MDSLILRDSTDPSMLGHAADIKNAAASLVAIIDDILDLSSIETGKIQIVPAEYDLSSLINDCYNMIIMRAQGKGLTLKVENNSDIPARLIGDETRIRQIIINLLTNAVKYTRQGGVILGLDYEKISDESILLRITVKDSGIGVKPENIDRLFTSYERVDEKKNRGIEGTGLGLSITKQLVTLMNGEISVRSEYGSWSEFTVIIPQKTVSSEPVGSYDHMIRTNRDELPARPVWFRAAGARILVVDDVEMNLKVMDELLSASGMQVDLVSGGEECLRAVVQCRYDLIFMDHMMPAPDGIETFRRMKTLPGSLNTGTPVVMLTANAVAGAREQYMSEGFCGYLSKPVDEAELMRICREQLDPGLISENTACDTVNGADEADMELIGALSGILDVDEGLRYCMNKTGFYLSMLRDFADTERADKILGYYDRKDIDNYRISVHSLKSTARTVGADVVSEEAQKLEEAARNGNTGYIVSCNGILISDYRELAGRITEMLALSRNDKKTHIRIERDEMIQLLEKARDCAQIMDMDGTDEAVGRLAEAELDDSLEEGLRKLRKAGNELEFEGIEAAADEMLDILRDQTGRGEGAE
jgi:CheY-like chemotaxis protein